MVGAFPECEDLNYIQCTVDSAIRLVDVIDIQNADTGEAIRGFEKWIAMNVSSPF